MASPHHRDEYSASFHDESGAYSDAEDLLGASGPSELLVDSPDDPAEAVALRDAYSDGDDDDDDDDGTINEQVEQIKRAYVNEKVAPEVLRHETELVADLLEQVHEQQKNIDDAVETRRINSNKLSNVVLQLKVLEKKARDGQLLPDESLKRHELKKLEPALQSAVHSFPVALYQMELDRVKYLLSAYLRVRLAKIQRQALYIVTNAEAMAPMLSPSEQEFVQMYAEIKVAHLHGSVLEHMPEKYRALNEKAMMEGPNLDVHVFCRVIKDAEPFIPPGSFSEPIALEKGASFMIKYSAIRAQLRAGTVELC